MNTMLLAPLARSASRGLWLALRRLLRGRARLLVAGLLLVGTAAGILATTQTTTAATVAAVPAPRVPVQVTMPATAPAPALAVPAAPEPATTTITLLRGDTLWALARHYRTTVADLQQLNQLGNSTLIHAGATLRIPANAAPATRPAPQPSPAMTSRSGAHGSTASPTTRHTTQPTARTNAAVPARSAPVTGAGVRATAATVFGPEYGCAANIITRESGWNPSATNPQSGAYGLAQALPGSKMASSGPNWRTDPATQLAWMRDYVTARYGGACNAWAFWQTHHWY